MEKLREQLASALLRAPEKTALYHLSGETFSYGDLRHWSQQVGTMWPLPVPGQRIAVCLPKSFSSVAAIFGVIQSGAAYLPLDSDAPVDRNAFILEDAQASHLITNKEIASALRGKMPILGEDKFSMMGTDLYILRFDWTDKASVQVPDDLAYILYTSGSTGKPKGVMITDANAICFIEWTKAYFEIKEQDIISSIAPFHFDLSVFDLYAGIFSGASIVLIDSVSSKNPMLLAELMDRFGITVWYATPTTLKMMLRFGRMDHYQHDRLRLVLFAGEVFPIEPLNALQTRWKQASFHNLYGPTETNVCTWYDVPSDPDPLRTTPYPIGQPCPYAEAFILTEEGIHVPKTGMVGELLIGGASVMPGYLNQPERNSTCLINHHGKMLYTTGDIVTVDDAGQLIYMTRKDRMVKRSGYRIELGEIEAVLHRHPQITEAGVVSLSVETLVADKQILAFYSTQNGEPIPALELKEFLQSSLPLYMQPDRFTHLPVLPKTSTHKIDYPELALLN